MIGILKLNSNTQKHLTVCKQMDSNSFKNKVTYKLFAYIPNIHNNGIWH